MFLGDSQVILFFIGLVSNFFGVFAGGSGLITIPAMMLIGLPVQVGVATNKFSSGLSFLSTVVTLVRKGLLDGRTVGRILPIAVPGGALGAMVTVWVPQEMMKGIAVFLLIGAFLFSFRKPSDMDHALGQEKETASDAPVMARAVPFFIAMYDGGFGPGASTMGIMHYMKRIGAYAKAVHLTRIVIFGSCLGAFFVFWQTGHFQWKWAIPLALGSIIGAECGIRLLPYIRKSLAEKWIRVIMVLLIWQLAVQVWDIPWMGEGFWQ